MTEPNIPLLESTDPKKFNEVTPKPPSAPVVPLLMNNSAPLAIDEVDEIDADHHTNSVPLATFPGIDNEFFDERNSNSKIPEISLTMPSTPETAEIPIIGYRFGEDENDSTKKGDEVDSKNGDEKALKANRNFLNPSPQFGMDFETMSTMGAGDSSIPDVNIYQHKKTLAQGMMDLALFSANANQLRYVVESSQHPYFYPSMIMITFSLILQVAVGIGLIWNATYNVKDEKEICIANKINNFTVIGIFLVTVINVFISAFGVANTNQT